MMARKKILNINQKGFAALFITLLVLLVVLGMAISFAVLTLSQERVSRNITKSTQSYYLAEAGIEDIILRITKNMQWSSPYNINLAGGQTAITTSDVIGGSRTITSTGNFSNRIRKIQTVYKISTQNVTFYFGIQVGNLGLQMDGNAVVHGNIFSNGPISGSSNTKIYGDAISAGPAGSINNMKIKSSEGGGSAWATTLTNCTIDGDAHYANISGCSVAGTHYTPEEGPAPQEMPISQEKITSWKNDATAGGTIPEYYLGGNNTGSLGPVKVNGDMTLDSNAKLTITGTVWVAGNLSLNSNSVIQLDPGYGSFSGTIVVDGKVSVDSNVVFCGSEGYAGGGKCNPSVGSFIMLLSTKNSVNPGSPAIYATSNSKTAILYASAGFITLGSNAKLREATGYGIYMSSNAEVIYEIGLADIRFTSGPGGGWKVTSWKEIE